MLTVGKRLVLFGLLIGLCLLGAVHSARATPVTPTVQNVTLLSGVTSQTAGPWIDVGSSNAIGFAVGGFGSATVQFEVSMDATTAFPVNCSPSNSTTPVATTTSAGGFQCAFGGYHYFRLNVTVYSSGTLNATGQLTTLGAGRGGGGGGGGSASVGSNTAVQGSNGAGAFTDTGCTGASASITCSSGFTSSGAGIGTLTLAKGTAPGAPGIAGQDVVYFDTADSLFKSQENGGSVVTYYSTANATNILSLTNTAAYAAITNTSTETFFAIGNDGKLAAGRLNTLGVRLEIEAAGIYSTNGATDTINLKIKLCTVSGCTSGGIVQVATTGVVTPGVGVTNQGWNFRVVCNTFTTGASGTIDCQGRDGATYFTALTTAIKDDIVNTAASGAIDLTAIEFVSVSATWNNISTNNSITIRNWNVKAY